MTPGRVLAAGTALLGALLLASSAALSPPPVVPATAPAGAFSAERAAVALRAFVDAGGGPRPAGSTANEAARRHVVLALRSLGLEPRTATEMRCGRYLACTPVGNVVARVPGRGGARPVLLVAHLDSVPAGPGAADDAHGVAVLLEVARALRAEPAASDVILLVDDAEESGLIGAEAFLAEPEAREVGAIVNVEARGTGGPSLLFETAGASATVVQAFAGGGGQGSGARRPLGSSLFPAVYRFIPNDTDLTVLRTLGVPAANLAFIEGALRYHTPEDDLAHLDLRTLQHQGENALALVRGLAGGLAHAAGADAVAPPREVVWFDLLGLAVVRFPERHALPLALLSLVLALVGAVADVRRGRVGAGRVAAGVAALPLAATAAALLGFAAGRAPGLDLVLRPWVASPGPLVAAFLLAGGCGAAVAAVALSRAGPAGLRGGVRIGLALGAVGLAAAVPGASFLLLVPALAAGAAGLLASGRGETAEATADLATIAAGAVVLLPPAWLLYPALGHSAGAPAALLVALAALPLAPQVASLPARGRLLALAVPAAALAAAVAAALAVPLAGPDAPERIVVYFHQDADTGRARVLASPDLGRLPGPVRAAAPFSSTARVALPWGALRPSFESDAAPSPDPGPAVEDLRSWRDGPLLRATFRLRSQRGAPELQVAIPPSVPVRSLSVDGVAVPPPAPKLDRWFGGWRVLRVTAPPEGVRVSVAVEHEGPLDLTVADASPALPPPAAAVARARPAHAVTQQEGDLSLFTRAIRIEAAAAGGD